MRRLGLLLCLALALLAAGTAAAQDRAPSVATGGDAGEASPLAARIVAAAHAQVGVTRVYDPAYVRLDFPGGDVPADRGVCTDVVIRALRAVGLDLQVAVNQDMRANFARYPNTWGLSRPDRNIDHRRVPNLETWFQRAGHARPSTPGSGYRPGDIVSWRLSNGLPHIGVVSDRRAADGSGRYLVVHNIGAGARVEDVLLAWPQVGHYRLGADAVPAPAAP